MALYLLDRLDLDFSEMLCFVCTTMCLHGAMVVLLALFYGAIRKFDLFSNSWIQQPNASTKISNPDVYKCIKHVAKLHLILQPLGLPGFYVLMKARGMRFDSPGPDVSEILLHITVFFIVEDALFYWIHRLLHYSPYLYKNFHKFHHSYHQPISLAAEYSHPLDYFLTGSIPTFTGALLMNSHVWTYYLWLFIRLIESQDGHSGYDLWFMPFRYFPFRPGAQVHDYHHSHNKGNYGSLFTFWDYLCGTDQPYKQAMNKKHT